MINVVVSGCNGAMGRVLTKAIEEMEDITIVAEIDKNINSYKNASPVYESPLSVKEECDVIIDFSKPSNLSGLLEYSVNNNIALVIATTGFSEEEENKIKEASKFTRIFKSSNMSLGVNVLINLSKQATNTLGNITDIEIIEKHHNKKVDAPSGTAKMIANAINKELDDSMEFNYGRSGNDAKRKEKEIIKLRHKKVNLHCGGYIVIDKTEAMYVIDVNSGKNVKGRDFNKTIMQTNLEAAKEVGRQIRLRNLSGIIVVDFIDMRDESQKVHVIKALKKSLEADKGNVKIFPFTELDLIQISRKRKGKSIYEYLEEPCGKCKSNGFILKLSYIENLIRNEIIKCYNENSIKDFYIEIDKNYEEDIKQDIFKFLKNIEGIDKEIYLNFVYDIEGYRIEPLIFVSQKENYQKYKIKTIEKL